MVFFAVSFLSFSYWGILRWSIIDQVFYITSLHFLFLDVILCVTVGGSPPWCSSEGWDGQSQSVHEFFHYSIDIMVYNQGGFLVLWCKNKTGELYTSAQPHSQGLLCFQDGGWARRRPWVTLRNTPRIGSRVLGAACLLCAQPPSWKRSRPWERGWPQLS